jgi:hypothetical protein
VQPSIVARVVSSSRAGKGRALNRFTGWKTGNKTRFVFGKFGVGVDLAYNVLQRIPDVRLRAGPRWSWSSSSAATMSCSSSYGRFGFISEWRSIFLRNPHNIDCQSLEDGHLSRRMTMPILGEPRQQSPQMQSTRGALLSIVY